MAATTQHPAMIRSARSARCCRAPPNNPLRQLQDCPSPSRSLGRDRRWPKDLRETVAGRTGWRVEDQGDAGPARRGEWSALLRGVSGTDLDCRAVVLAVQPDHDARVAPPA